MGVIEVWDITSSEIVFKWELNGVQISHSPPRAQMRPLFLSLGTAAFVALPFFQKLPFLVIFSKRLAPVKLHKKFPQTLCNIPY
jgi:hypothetical protein